MQKPLFSFLFNIIISNYYKQSSYKPSTGNILGKNLPAFLQHLAAFGGQMRNLRTITCSVQYRLRCGILPHLITWCSILPHLITRYSILPHPTTLYSILPYLATQCKYTTASNNIVQYTTVSNNIVQHTAVYNNVLQHTTASNNAVQLIAHLQPPGQVVPLFY